MQKRGSTLLPTPSAEVATAARTSYQDLSARVALDPWEEAYLRFETPEQEIQKFLGRLRKLGAADWPRDSRILEIFSGRGNALRALERLGFAKLQCADLSPRLLAEYRGAANRVACDCRRLPFADHCQDIVIVQGGLHHLPELPGDLEETLAEVQRVLAKAGRIVIVEPWRTGFLNLAHFISENALMRRAWGKLDALAVMTHYERTTYEQWLSQPKAIQEVARAHFKPIREFVAWGKWNFVGAPL